MSEPSLDIDPPKLPEDQASLLLRILDDTATDDDFELYTDLLQSDPVFAEAAEDVHLADSALRSYFEARPKE